MAKLDSDPLPPPDRGRPEVGQGVAINAVIQALYTTDLWPALADALDQAQHGDGDGLLALSDTYLERDDDGTWTNSIEAFIAISCLDDPVPRDVASYATLGGASSRSSRRDWDGRSPPATSARSGRCHRNRGPQRPARARHRSSSSARPATRSRPSSRRRRSPTRSRAACLLVREGEGHTAYGQDECVDDAIDSYLIDLTVPADGTRC